MNKFFFVLFFVVISVSVHISFAANQDVYDDFQKWLTDFKVKLLIDKKISQKTIDKAFKNIKYNPKVIHKDKNQPEFIETFGPIIIGD